MPKTSNPPFNQIKWEEIDELINEIIALQKKKMLRLGQSIVPQLTQDDMLQPNDFLPLETNPEFRYEEGRLAGVQTVQMALWALLKEQM